LAIDGTKYEGQFYDNKMHGIGILTSPLGDGSIEKYEGNWVSNERSGSGVQLYQSGAKYVGSFKKNQR
jgi:hypothetical protein